METLGQYDTYKSKHVRFLGLSSLILDDLVNSPFDFYSYKTFWGGIGVSGELNLSGYFYVNKDLPPEIWKGYNVTINAGDINLNSYNMQLSSENLAAYVDNGQIKSWSDDSKSIVRWAQDGLTVDVPFNADDIRCANLTATGTATCKDISCQNLTASGNAKFTGTAVFTNTIQGCSLCALWADLAEMYRSDGDYAPGTLVSFGGDAEITIAQNGTANAVITDKPGLVLNGAGKQDGLYKGIALVGRTPVLTVGPVRRFDRLAQDPRHPGMARRAAEGDRVIAVSFGDVPDGELRCVECAV